MSWTCAQKGHSKSENSTIVTAASSGPCDGAPASDVRAWLRESRVNVSISPQRYTRLDMEGRGLPEVVRASVHYYNTEREVDLVCDRVAQFS